MKVLKFFKPIIIFLLGVLTAQLFSIFVTRIIGIDISSNIKLFGKIPLFTSLLYILCWISIWTILQHHLIPFYYLNKIKIHKPIEKLKNLVISQYRYSKESDINNEKDNKDKDSDFSKFKVRVDTCGCYINSANKILGNNTLSTKEDYPKDINESISFFSVSGASPSDWFIYTFIDYLRLCAEKIQNKIGGTKIDRDWYYNCLTKFSEIEEKSVIYNNFIRIFIYKDFEKDGDNHSKYQALQTIKNLHKFMKHPYILVNRIKFEEMLIKQDKNIKDKYIDLIELVIIKKFKRKTIKKIIDKARADNISLLLNFMESNNIYIDFICFKKLDENLDNIYYCDNRTTMNESFYFVIRHISNYILKKLDDRNFVTYYGSFTTDV